MYKSKSFKYGACQAIQYENSQSGNSFSIIPELGANIYRLQLNNGKKSLSLIDGATDHELDTNPFYKSTFLLPFPNRIKHGKYNFDGQSYQLPVNEPKLNNALHGFICHRKFEVMEEDLAEGSATIVLKNFYLGDYEGYPFPFETTIEITLSDEDGVTLRMDVANTTAKKIPIGMGWHPYFSFDHDIADVLLKMPPCLEVEVDQFNIPTGEKRSFDAFSRPQKIDHSNFDHCFQIDDPNNRVETILTSPAKEFSLHIWQENDIGKFQFLQIFTPPGRRSIAIEPMTCCIDAFNNQLGLVILDPGEKISAKFGLKVSG